MTLVGIFSREDISCYNWLINNLVASRSARDVRPVTITNNFLTFQEEASKCNFAILYHSKNRGRVNVTDVTDSLYDRELQHLCDVHGRNNVLVVIDDLNSSSESEKQRILTHQPSIRELARDLFIFSSEDKAALTEGGYQSSPHTLRALDDIKRVIKGRKGRVSHDIERQPSETSTHPTQRRPIPSRRCIIIILALIAFIGIILIIVLNLPKNHHLGAFTPVHSTEAPKYYTVSSNMTTIMVFNTTVLM
ncbi:uncharacterized protein LOC142216530 [Leptodactylus fuscus]|uniref:uncharacterized protein LOC142216530 n=1 Tax=Leptodactylus fuscus TaxID=238119 RepID=UPI003F4E6BD3